jgi:HlyD family secretion protein
MKARAVAGWSALAAIVVAGGLMVATRRASGRASGKTALVAQDDIPLAQVQRGDLDVRVHATGALRASHSMMLTAPSVGGGALQITKLLLTSSAVKKGDIVIEFDPIEQHYKMEQSHSELLEAEQEITKANDDAAVLAAQDKVTALKDRYAVRQAELDVQKNEIVSSIDGKKNDLALQNAQRVQAEHEKDMQSHKESGQASIYLAKEKYNKAKLQMDQAQQNIEKMNVIAPMDGLVSIQKNHSDGFGFTGMFVPDYHAGDEAYPGRAIAQIVDPMGLELSAKLSERNADNIKVGQPVEVVFDAIPGRTFHGTVKTVGGMASANIFDDDAGGTFEVTVQLGDPDARLHSGFSAQLVFLGDRKMNVLYLPRQALFLKDGKRIVFVKRGNGYEQQTVKIQGQTESRAVIDGIAAGTQVALIDPTAPRKSASSGAGSVAGAGTP